MDTTTVGVSVRVAGIDLDAPDTVDALATQFSSAMWEERDGLVVMTVSVPSENPLDQAVELCRRLEGLITGAKVEGVDRDLVNVSDIAQRVELSREAVRKWTGHPDFPSPQAVVGRDSMKIWAWTQVVDWLLAVRGIDMAENLLTTQQMTQLENCLMGNPDHTTVQWHTIARSRTAFVLTYPATQQNVATTAAGRGQSVMVADPHTLVLASSSSSAH